VQVQFTENEMLEIVVGATVGGGKPVNMNEWECWRDVEPEGYSAESAEIKWAITKI
jgi:hypothetical protein